jgi:hypothetical protein
MGQLETQVQVCTTYGSELTNKLTTEIRSSLFYNVTDIQIGLLAAAGDDAQPWSPMIPGVRNATRIPSVSCFWGTCV